MNESETKDDIIYLLGVDEGSNPDGAVLTVDGKNILGGIEILVPYNETVKKTLSLSRTREDIENYDNIILSLSTVCQSDPTSNNPVIESTAEIAAHFVPSCGNININRKLDNTIINICQMDPTKDYGLKGIFPVEINDYDINNKKLETITIYYKSSVEGENGWRMLQQYYNNPGANQEKIPEGNIDFEWNLVDRNVRDGIYNVKAVALGRGNLRSETEVLTFTLDTKMPEVFGTPAPSSGVLRPGDDISITYNKNLQGSLILPSINENISVKGILNNQEIDHTTGILFDGKEGFMIMPNGVNLDNKSFTVEMWLKPLTYNKYQTVFTHGAGDNLFNMSFTADKRLEIKVGSKTYKSENTLNEDQFGNGFAQYQIVYNMSDAKLNVYVNNIHMLSLPSGAPDFTLSRWIFGCDENQANHFNGIIHDLRLWNSMIDATTLNKSLSVNEVDLIGYWPMDEISGSAVKDKARENHAVSKADRFIDPIGKCIELTGPEFVTVPLYALSKNYDFTYEI